ncbi:hypothetical protein LTR91_025150 [Friedmanniomyces endolithicus]|uniref:Glutaredoxin-like protein n=1 Tax=Friedmanniomyces endolithicus TaxID=329885 RepID=A0AAN6FBD1_9PEZI|nr:hypothetical protein LTS09_017596 [Friedmanniomyces endolithicus]KAK0266711.1 hypothetical protein LTR35_016871 [Friedmanniomyces endolithicus]KAK0273171.1 hypothetical protein LTS00_015925 [Friedmanniomyces endolithicus]KAK0303141.1 hypothetical protein LTR01_008287 [Friedmanniomyces endolithicus]KAK0307783.1 hypothetical protein LTR82_015820 [Friedmanniomyces endolithicus]
MRVTSTLRQLGLRLTLFTRANCSLCDDAKAVLERTRNTRRFEYTEIDVMVAGYDKWKALYEFDTPVVHVDQAKELYKGTSQGEGTTAQAKKLMHRFTEAQLKATMDEVEHNTAS